MTQKSNVADYTINNDKLFGIYRGVVEDNKDPDRLCRCRIRVLGVHDELLIKDDLNGIPTEELPWTEPCYGLFQGSVSGNGTWMVPLQGSYVFVFFESGNWMQPRYFLTAPGLPVFPPDPLKGFNDPAEEWPDANGANSFGIPWLFEPDTHRLMKRDWLAGTSLLMNKLPGQRIGNDIAIGGAWDEYPPMYQAKYPYNNVFHSYKDIYVEIDNTDANERFHLYHPSNSYIEIGPLGEMTIRNALDRWDITMNCKFEETCADYHRLSRMNRTSKTLISEYEEVMETSYRKIHVNDRKDVLDTQWYYVYNAEKLWLDGDREKFILGYCSEQLIGDKKTMIVGDSKKFQLGDYDTFTLSNTKKWMVGSFKTVVIGDPLLWTTGMYTKFITSAEREITLLTKYAETYQYEDTVVWMSRNTYVDWAETKQIGDVLTLRAGVKIIIEAPEIEIRGMYTGILTEFTDIAGVLTWNGVAFGVAADAMNALKAMALGGTTPVPESVAAVPNDPVVPPLPLPLVPMPMMPMPPMPLFRPDAIPAPPAPVVPPVLDYSDEPPEPDVCP